MGKFRIEKFWLICEDGKRIQAEKIITLKEATNQQSSHKEYIESRLADFRLVDGRTLSAKDNETFEIDATGEILKLAKD